MFRTALISMFLTSTALATTWTVDDDGKADFDNIQAAVDAASNGDEIVVMPGTYTSANGSWMVVDMLGKAVWLHSSQGSKVTIIDGEYLGRGILCASSETSKTIIEGFTITGGFDDYGGGMLNDNSNPTLTHCIFEDNNAVNRGGGMYNYNSSPTLTNCIFTGNSAQHDGGGGMINHNSNPTLTNCTFTNNSTNNRGGGMANSFGSNPTITGCTFTGNYASGDGGGIAQLYAEPSIPTLTDTTVCGNTPNQILGGFNDGGGNYISEFCTYTGVCCIGSNCSIMTASDCSASGGTYLGDNTNCNGDPCYIPPTGACCISASCSVMTESDCLSSGGTYFSDEITCDDLPCSGGTGHQWGGNGHWYLGVATTSELEWDSARIAAEAIGGHLLSIDTPVESEWIGTNIAPDATIWKWTSSTCTGGPCSGPWIGAFNNGNGWAWVDGSEWLFENWHPGNPDNCCPSVVSLWDFYGTRAWQDHPIPTDIDPMPLSYIVEWSADCNGDGIVDYGQILDGTLMDGDGNGIPDDCDCLADINGDGYVNVTDLLAVIDQWGLTDSPADLNQNGIVDVSDLLIVISNWGPCE